MITLTAKEWVKIRKKLKEEYSWKPSIFLIRETMKRELGFTTRYHREWVPGLTDYKEIVYLDFYDDPSETMFRLKYL
jgi:hypothetical protein